MSKILFVISFRMISECEIPKAGWGLDGDVDLGKCKGALTWPPLGFILASVALRKKTIMAHMREHACGSHVAPEQRTMTLDARAVGADPKQMIGRHNEVLR